MQVPAAFAEKLRRYLARQAKHGFVRAECGQQCRAGIENTGAGHHAENAGLARGARVAIGHVAAGLFVPRADHLQLCLLEGVEQTVDLRTRQSEDGVNAMRNKTANDCFAA